MSQPTDTPTTHRIYGGRVYTSDAPVNGRPCIFDYRGQTQVETMERAEGEDYAAFCERVHARCRALNGAP